MCGNFGILLLEQSSAPKVQAWLAAMLRITKMRGAQSAGMVTYIGQRGERRRVVNGKRTDLCRLLMRRCAKLTHPGQICAPQLFQGHTRFATSSISDMKGVHPHQWSPPIEMLLWRHSDVTCSSWSDLRIICRAA